MAKVVCLLFVSHDINIDLGEKNSGGEGSWTGLPGLLRSTSLHTTRSLSVPMEKKKKSKLVLKYLTKENCVYIFMHNSGHWWVN